MWRAPTAQTGVVAMKTGLLRSGRTLKSRGMSQPLPRTLLVVALAGATGCATQSQSAAFAEPANVTAEVPLGSRIKKKSPIAPTSGVQREEIEQTRAQAGAIRAGIVNDRGGLR